MHVPRLGIEGVIKLRDLSKSTGQKEPESRFVAEEWRLDVKVGEGMDGDGEWVRIELFQKVIVRIWDELEEGTGKRRVRMGLAGVR